jgi:triosephosphate isomerase
MHTSLQQPGLKVILCVGETLQEYENGLLERVVDTQIRKGLDGIDASVLLNDRVIIAYEPVWAIGTGLVATPAQAQHAHLAIRSSLANMYGANSGVSESVRIQYGGSVTPDSIEELSSENDVDGALVGGASLNADSFTRVYDGSATANAKKKVTVETVLKVSITRTRL